MVALIDYDAGNILSVQKAIEHLGEKAVLTRDPKILRSADKVILPGVGAFGDAMEKIRGYNLEEVIKETADSGKPFLGVCLGLQIMFDESEEAPGVKGLSVLPGKIKKIPTGEFKKIPHMGWNSLELKNSSPLMENADGKYVYFVHSYFCDPEDKSIITAVTDYGTEVTAAVGKGSVQAFQFHPEKSSKVGIALLKAFKEWQP